MGNIFKITIRTIRIIYKIIQIPIGFLCLLFGLGLITGLINDPVSCSNINYIMMIVIGGIFLWPNRNKKEQNEANKEQE